MKGAVETFDMAKVFATVETSETSDVVETVEMFEVAVRVGWVSWVDAICEIRKPFLLFPFLRMVLGMHSLFPILLAITQISSLSILGI